MELCIYEYIRHFERMYDGVDYNRIMYHARSCFPAASPARLDAALHALYQDGFIERRYDGNYEIPEF